MTDLIRGIHHITAVAGDAQGNLDFHVGVLGLRLVKRTVNFDDPGTYHFYFADHAGSPGSVLTYFPWRGIKPGRPGIGETVASGFAVGPDSIGWWADRLRRLNVNHEPPVARLDGEEVIAFQDGDGTRLEIIAAEVNAHLPQDRAGPLPPEHAIRGFHSATLAVADTEPTAQLLTELMGFRAGPVEGNRFRFIASAPAESRGRFIDLLRLPDAPPAQLGAGNVHHIAFRTPDDEAQERFRQALTESGYRPTPLIDRQYFHSIYFREPGGVLFEFATDPPGFAIDEPLEALGEALKLPERLESERGRIEAMLPAITSPQVRT